MKTQSEKGMLSTSELGSCENIIHRIEGAIISTDEQEGILASNTWKI